MPLPLLDTHCHLNVSPMNGHLSEVLERARQNGLVGIIAPGTDEETSRQVVELAEQYPSYVWAAVGVHPQIASTKPVQQNILEMLLQRPGVIAIGEIGLDYEVEAPDRTTQIQRFAEQLAIAYHYHLPSLIHCRKAFGDLQQILQKLGQGPGGILHSWAGSWDVLKPLLDLGFYYGVSGVITRAHAVRRREAIKQLPLDRMVLETDAPYIGTKTATKGKVEPCHTLEVCHAVAEIKEVTIEEVAETTTQNARRVLRLLR